MKTRLELLLLSAWRLLLFLFSVCLLLPGCPSFSLHPLYSDQDVVLEPALAGTWTCVPAGNEKLLFQKASRPHNPSKENDMTSKYLWRGALIVILGVALARPAVAQIGKISGPIGPSAGPIIAGIVGAAAAVVVVTVVVIHESTKKRAITGCVISGENGMSVENEKDKRLYALSGDMTGIKPGDRMTLQGKKIKSSGSNPLTWEIKKIAKDLGVCQP
jgi:hypothetical protein